MPVHYGSKELNNITVSSPLGIINIMKEPKFHKLLGQDMRLEQPTKKRSQPVTSEKVLLVKVTSQLP